MFEATRAAKKRAPPMCELDGIKKPSLGLGPLPHGFTWHPQFVRMGLLEFPNSFGHNGSWQLRNARAGGDPLGPQGPTMLHWGIFHTPSHFI